METITVSTRMQSLITLYDMHSKFLSKAIDGISEKDAHNRLNTKANHVAWIIGSLVRERFELAALLGVTGMKKKAEELFKDHKGIQENAEYPPLSEFMNDFEKITPALRSALLNVTDEKLDSMYEMPEMKMTNYEFMAFMIYREANLIGQIALWRRLLGYSAMNYM